MLTLALLALASGGGARAGAAQTARVRGSFSPYRLGSPTSMTVSFQITAAGGLPSPLTYVTIDYPHGLGLITSELGTATCSPQTLEAHGPHGCPSDSLMGSGTALARFRIGPEVFSERATLGIVAGPPQANLIGLLVSATGLSPVATRIVMTSVLRPGSIALSVPLVPSLPEGEDVAVTSVRATLGGSLRYSERIHGRTVYFHPRGISLPRTCPRGGFRFAGSFTFLDGTSTEASSVLACPERSR